MITKTELLESTLRECRIAKQLFTQVPKDGWDYRFSDGQRSTLELARYLCKVGQGCVHAANTESFDWFGTSHERFEALGVEDLPGAMDEQINEITRLFGEISDEDFATKRINMGDMGEWTLQGWLLQTTLKFLTAYRLQLFLQAKAAGNTALDTWDCWNNDGSVNRPEPATA